MLKRVVKESYVLSKKCLESNGCNCHLKMLENGLPFEKPLSKTKISKHSSTTFFPFLSDPINSRLADDEINIE